MCTTWKARETARLEDGAYRAVPVTLDYPKEHFVHLSTSANEPDYVAYTPNDTYGVADRQVRLKFGRYLKKTFADMSDAAIQGHVTSLKVCLRVTELIDDVATLKFATDRDTITRIFETEMKACGSPMISCMHDKFTGEVRPYHVYADSPDVAVAYVETSGVIMSRSVVSTKDMAWVRTYANTDHDNDTQCGLIKDLLDKAGYSKGDLEGNWLTYLGSKCVPYIDNSGAYITRDGKYWLVVSCERDAEYQADKTDGTVTSCEARCERCDNPQDDCECIYCECCDERYYGGCDRCNFCEHCERCITHTSCDCERCSECERLIDNCRCERCAECSELTDDCECSRCDSCDKLTENCECADEDEEEMDTPLIPILQIQEEITVPVEPEEKTARTALQGVWSYLLQQRLLAVSDSYRFTEILEAMRIIQNMANLVRLDEDNAKVMTA